MAHANVKFILSMVMTAGPFYPALAQTTNCPSANPTSFLDQVDAATHSLIITKEGEVYDSGSMLLDFISGLIIFQALQIKNEYNQFLKIT